MSINLTNQSAGGNGSTVPVSGQSEGGEPEVKHPSFGGNLSAVPSGQEAVPAGAENVAPPVTVPDTDLIAPQPSTVKESSVDPRAARLAELEAAPELSEFISNFRNSKAKALPVLAKLATEFNAKAEGRALNTQKIEFVLLSMTPDDLGTLSSVLNSGQLALSNSNAFKLVLSAHSHDSVKPFEALDPQALLEHAISAASGNNRYGVIESILTQFSDSVNLENALRSIEAKGSIINPVTAKPYSDVLTDGLRSDLSVLSEKIKAAQESKRVEEVPNVPDQQNVAPAFVPAKDSADVVQSSAEPEVAQNTQSDAVDIATPVGSTIPPVSTPPVPVIPPAGFAAGVVPRSPSNIASGAIPVAPSVQHR